MDGTGSFPAGGVQLSPRAAHLHAKARVSHPVSTQFIRKGRSFHGQQTLQRKGTAEGKRTFALREGRQGQGSKQGQTREGKAREREARKKRNKRKQGQTG